MKLAKPILSTSTLNYAPSVIKTLPCSDCQIRILDTAYRTMMHPKYHTNQCLLFMMLFFTSTSQQLAFINPFLSSPKKHLKLQCITVSHVKSFPQTPALLYLSAKIHISDKSRNESRNNVSFLSQAFRRASVITNLFMMYTEHAKISFLVFYCCFFSHTTLCPL